MVINNNDIQIMLDHGLLVKQIAEYYNVDRHIIGKHLKQMGLNLRNHKNQRQHQSTFMKMNNPVPQGSHRPQYIKDILARNRQESLNTTLDNWMLYDFKQYAKVARAQAYRVFNRHTPRGCEIDHIYSIYDGFKNRVPIRIISHPANLRLTSIADNKSKSNNSLIDLKTLYRITNDADCPIE
mgnify:CR=1 FL=1